MLSSWDRIRNLEQPEQFLYSCLRYGFLRQRRLSRRIVLEGLTAVDFESVVVSARETRGHEVEWQNDLRCVVAFLCWRKETVRSASLLILRFFHGFFPAEIAQIAILPRTAVYDAIDYARQETKSYLKDPGKLLEMHRGAPPVLQPSTLLPDDQFAEDLMQGIFDSCRSKCKSQRELLERYRQGAGVPIDHHLLAHLASCRRCLDVLIEKFELPPRGTRSLDDSLASAPRATRPGPRQVVAEAVHQQSLKMARLRCEEALQHRPHGLVLFVDGRAIASRDVRSDVNELLVELPEETAPEFLEVVSEQGLILLSTWVGAGGGEQSFSATFPDERSMEIDLRIDDAGCEVHLRYVDPVLGARMSRMDEGSFAPKPQCKSGWLSDFFLHLRALAGSVSLPVFATVAATLLACVLVGLRPATSRMTNDLPSAQTVLEHSIAATEGNGVEQQTIRIRLAGAGTVVTLHRDRSHKHTPMRQAVPEMPLAVDTKLAEAGMTWSDPLSAGVFEGWRAKQVHPVDSISEQDGVVTVATKLSSGAVRSSALSVRESDWHPIARVTHFANGEIVEVAELEDVVLPWQQSSIQWFESDARPTIRIPANLGKKLDTAPSASELAATELSARLALARSGSDLNERLSITRGEKTVTVEGLIADPARRNELRVILADLPHLSVHLRTFEEAEAKEGKTRKTTEEHFAVSVATGTISGFDQWMLSQHYATDDVTRLHAVLFDAVSALRQGQSSLAQIDGDGRTNSLSPEAEQDYEELWRIYVERIARASRSEAKLLNELHVSTRTEATSSSSLSDEVQQNAAICLRLLSGAASQQDDAPALLQQLARVQPGLEAQVQSSMNIKNGASSTALNANAARRP
ncbi:DNA-directed RNA polymerase specialized sigma24 family protein [Granulicella aggregans]|uniref:DNA-directed RNA polymerase specialized sigma24 family protein n=2 Tax=Granulicella aggregans TaxID=474949 RepID=A0A7W7Z9F7_9BACT|nr:DNA-directed RNA polymerase specialized sigma24 family protein [Granulicella aggregans]